MSHYPEKDRRYRSDFFNVHDAYPAQEKILLNPDIPSNKDPVYNYVNSTSKITNHKNTRAIENYEIYDYKCSSTMSPFMRVFFSRQNMTILQNQLKYQVFLKSDNKYIIDKQDPQELGTIMESMYYQYSSRPIEECLFKNEIERLNGIVLNYSVSNVIIGIRAQNGYLKKITDNITGMDIGISTTRKGLKISKTYTPKI